LNQQFKDFFYFNRTERRGILSLLIIIVILIAINLYLTYVSYQFPETKSQLDQIYAALEQDSLQNERFAKATIKIEENVDIKTKKDSLFSFDPNGLSIELWQKLGLSQKQAAVIKNYEAKGGKFRKKEDVQKMYTISEEVYQRLEPYIEIADKAVKQDDSENKSGAVEFTKSERDSERTYERKFVKPIVDINLADSATFKSIYGIGPYFSGKMVSYREELGGYSTKKQLTEIWGFSDSLLQAIDSQLVVSTINLQKIRLNQAAASELKEHPYIDWNLANSLVKIRAKHGRFESSQDLKRSVLVTDSLIDKLLPYISFE
jgi:DNA uptake protein ComE-like DNA-binding protein